MAQAWNRKRLNLSGSRNLDDFLHHSLDSLTPLAFLDESWPGQAKVLDLGSGAGFPGIPLALASSGWKVTLLEASSRKRVFLHTVLKEIGLDDRVKVLAGRAEVLGHDTEHREVYDLVFARAVAKMPALFELALPFVRIGGQLVSFVGNKSVDKYPPIVVRLLGGELKTDCKIDSKNVVHRNHILVVDKLIQTPDEFPRRPGIPEKRPLSG